MKKINKVLLTAVLVAFFVAVGLFSASAAMLNTVDGGTSEFYSSKYDLTVTVFGRTTCSNTKNVLTSLQNLGIGSKKNIKVNFADIDQASKETVAAFADKFKGSNISFCYDETSNLNSVMWAYARKQGISGSLTLPLTVFLDKEGEVVDATSGVVSEKVLSSISEDAKIYNSLLTLSVKGTENYNYAYEILALLNDLRASLGLSKLTMDKELLDIAMQRAAEIAIYYSHTRPNGASCFSLYNKNTYLGENIAIGYGSPAAVMNGWTNSPGHYKNMTNKYFSSAGIGAFKMSDGTLCWVQFFSGMSGDNYKTSGTKNVTAKVDAAFGKTNIELSADVYDPAELVPGDTFELKLVNRNLGFDYATQTLLLSDFKLSASKSKALSLNDDGTVTVKCNGSMNVFLTSKSNDTVVFSRKISAGHEHDYYLKSTQTQTSGCVTKTTKTYVCLVCYNSYTKTSSKATHTAVTDKAVKATCTKKGKTKGSHCLVCGKVLKAQTTVKPTGHKTDGGTVTKKATYSAEGIRTYKCKVCKKVLKKEVLPKRKLSQVKNLKAKAASASAIKLNWSKVSGAKKYEIYISTNGKSWTKKATVSKTGFTAEKLKAGKAYRFKVRALSGSAKGAYSSVVVQKTKNR